MNIKDFIEWIEHKFKINSFERVHQIKQGEVYWCSLGLNVGDEENGKGHNYRRPVLVFKKFNNHIFLAIPMSTQNKENKYYIKVTLRDTIQSAIISQIRVIDTKRLDSKIGYISKIDFQRLKDSVKDMIS